MLADHSHVNTIYRIKFFSVSIELVDDLRANTDRITGMPEPLSIWVDSDLIYSRFWNTGFRYIYL